MKKLLLIVLIFTAIGAHGQNDGTIGIPANADTTSTGFALKASLRPYLTKAQIIANFAPLVNAALTAPNIGVATATNVNKVTITTPATSATLTIKDGTTISNLASFIFDGAGKVALVAGTKAVTITGITTSSIAVVGFVSACGTITTTTHYAGVCTANTLTLTALTSASATNTSDTSTLSYMVVN